MEVDRTIPVPPSRQIADHVRRQIESGQIGPGQRIPSITELEQDWDVARDTIRKAIKILKDDGLVDSIQGMGIYVRSNADVTERP